MSRHCFRVTPPRMVRGSRAILCESVAMSSTDPAPVLWLAANNGEIGGGEVMLLRTAEAVRALGVGVGVVAPASSAVAEAAAAKGFPVAALPATGRRAWMQALRRWDRDRTGWLWCHGLVPAAATTGRPRRIVHLHQAPIGALQRILAVLARLRAAAVLVPSGWMTEAVPGATVLANWTDEVTAVTRSGATRPGTDDGIVRVGFLGRLSVAKGVVTLVDAMTALERSAPGRFRLLLAGEYRFVPDDSRTAVASAVAAAGSLVEQRGWVDRDDFLSQVDILAVPSIAPESFGLSAVEAMAAGVPVVVSDAGALPEVVGVPTALVVPAGDVTALADTLVAVADGRIDPAVAPRQARWRTEYSPAAGTRRVAELLGRLGIG